MVLHSKESCQGTNEIPRSATVHSFRAGPFRNIDSGEPYSLVVEIFPIKHEKLCMQIRISPLDFRPSGTMLSSPLHVACG